MTNSKVRRIATHFSVSYFSEELAILPNSDGYLKSVYQQVGHVAEEVGEKVF